jgi:hypothetical protein
MARRALLIALLALVVPGSARAAAPELLQPGIYLENTAGSGCTANFVYDGLDTAYGRVFLGTAAHCVTRRGETITSGGEAIGTVAAVGTAGTTATDWSLIEVAPALRDRVVPWLVGHPDLPHGTPLTPAEAAAGDSVQFDGYGQGFHLLAPTRESRTGVLESFTDAEVRIAGPASTGDSGGPAVHLPSGRPLAILTALQGYAHSDDDETVIANVTGPTTTGILAAAASAGVPVRLRTLDSPPVPVPAAPATAPASSAPPAAAADPPAARTAPARRHRRLSCKAKARRIKQARKRRAALRRCTRRRAS